MSILPTYHCNCNCNTNCNSSTPPRKRPVSPASSMSSSPSRSNTSSNNNCPPWMPARAIWVVASFCTVLVVFRMVCQGLMLNHQVISPSSTSTSTALILPESFLGSPAIGGFPLQKEEEEALIIEEELDDGDYNEESGVTQELRSAFSSVTLFLSESLLGSPAIGALRSEEDGQFDDDDDDDASGNSQDEENNQEYTPEEEGQEQTAEYDSDSNSQDYEDDLVDAVMMASSLAHAD